MAEVPKQIGELIAKFDQNLDAYHTQYGETEVRVEFINPFIEALGWDVTNKAAIAEAYKDVIHEAAVKVGGATKAPDYSFRIGGTRKFFLEAKRPSISIKDETGPAYQLRRYAWSAKLPLSILTNFAEFAVYDCHLKPKENDKASTGRILYFTYKDYASRWEEITAVFSKDAVLHGSFDKFADSGKGKRGTSQVDAEFLAEIESWRDALAKNLALRNPRLSVRDLNFAVQRTIDRVIFLRMCEDRGIEQYGQLQALLNGEHTYKRLWKHYRDADTKYNSGLFHFEEEKGRAEAPDKLTLNLKIDDKVLKDIIRRLYYPESPYEFSVLGADILGNVYEQFLGKVIRLTTGHQAKVEEKPEVKKAGGVYYTPAYIVEYIVKNTVGKLCEGKTPKQIEKLKILDPACGSGSFLIGAYTYLLNHHRDWYVKDSLQKHTKEIYQGSGGQWLLTTQEKKRILLNNIYGVDIDSQAVEVTKLSLLLRVLEGESEETIGKSLKLFRERALPDLGNNIKCGNSLIGPDFYANQQMSLPDDEERYRINVFDWNSEFSEIMKSGGFDAVIGNPPYGAYLYKQDKDYLAAHYPNQTYQLDSYLLFLEKAVRDLLKAGGHYGMIIPNPWLTNLLQDSMRRFVMEKARVSEIVHFKFPVFPKVVVDTEIVLLQKAKPDSWEATVTVAETLDAFNSAKPCKELRHLQHQQQKWRDLSGGVINIFTSESEEALAAKCRKIGQRLESYCDINVGIKPYQVGKGTPPQTRRMVEERPFDSDRRATPQHRQYLRGIDIVRYKIAPAEVRFLRYGPWLAEPRPAANFDAPAKIVMRQTGDSLIAASDTEQLLCLNNMHVLVPRDERPSLSYLLGVINSKLMNWCYHTSNPEVGEALAEVKKTNVAQLPIRPINFSDPGDKGRHDKVVSLVERMLDLHTQLDKAKNPNDKDRLQREIEATDRQIDQLVYELYGLTQEEIEIVETERC